MFCCTCLCVLFNKSLHIKRFKIVMEEAPSSGELDSGPGSENQFSCLCPSALNLTMLKRKHRWNYLKELKPPDRPDTFSHCFTGWRRELSPCSDVYQRDRATPQKRMKNSVLRFGKESIRGWTEASWHSRHPSHLRGFSEPPVISCPTHICNDSWTRLFL